MFCLLCNLTLELGCWLSSGVFLTDPQAKQTKKQIFVSKEKCFYLQNCVTATRVTENWKEGETQHYSTKQKTKQNKWKKKKQKTSRWFASEKSRVGNNLKVMIFFNTENNQNTFF